MVRKPAEEPDQYDKLVEREDIQDVEQENSGQEEQENNEPIAQNEETSTINKGKQKAVAGRLKKGEQIELTRVSSRSTKGQHTDKFAKKHFVNYVTFVAVQISSFYIPKNLMEALTGPEKEYWLDACKKQLGAVFSLIELGEVKNFLGVRIVRDRLLRTIKISQTPYIE